MTNREWLATLTDVELSKILLPSVTCEHCTYKDNIYLCKEKGCRNGIELWLKSEHEED